MSEGTKSKSIYAGITSALHAGKGSLSNLRTSDTSRQSGFTLIELAIVVLIIGLLASVSVFYGRNFLENAKRTQTARKLERIEQALQVYREQNDLLPCPAELTLTDADVSYGSAAGNIGDCTSGGTNTIYTVAPGPGYHTVVEGGVPVQTLGLPEEFMYDAWGHRIFYAVDEAMTDFNAFKNYTIYDHCEAIRVLDQNGTDRTSQTGSAVFALVSVGADGFGGISREGVTSTVASTDPHQQQNCDCNPDGTYAGFDASFVQREEATTGSNFDDLVLFKERWQMQTAAEADTPLYNGPDLAVANNNDTVIFYQKNCDTYTGTPYTLPAGATAANGISSSPDNNDWAVAYNGGNYLSVYRRNAATGSMALTTPIVLSSNATAVAFSATGNYLAVGYDSATFLNVYGNNKNGSYTPLTLPDGPDVPPAATVVSVAFSPSDYYMAAVDSGGVLTVYKRNGNAFEKIVPPLPLPPNPGGIKVVSFSPNGRYMVLGHGMTVELYTVDIATDTFTSVSTSNLGSLVTGLDFSHDSLFLAAGDGNTVSFHRIDPAALTLSASMGTSSHAAAAFSHRADRVALGHSSFGNDTVITYIPQSNSFSDAQNVGTPAGAATAVTTRH